MTCTASSTTALSEAVQQIGSQSALARLCGVTQTAVWKWLRAGKMPAEYVLTVERSTGVSRHLLRPDIYPVEQSHLPTAVGPVRSNDAPPFDCEQGK